jgi:hypothetical protein
MKARRFFNECYSGDVSEDVIGYFQTYLQIKALEFCVSILKEHERINQRRRECGLPEYRRIHLSEYINCGDEAYKPSIPNSGCGECGQHNVDTHFSGE